MEITKEKLINDKFEKIKEYSIRVRGFKGDEEGKQLLKEENEFLEKLKLFDKKKVRVKYSLDLLDNDLIKEGKIKVRDDKVLFFKDRYNYQFVTAGINAGFYATIIIKEIELIK